jgi:hypothetical protein
MRPRGNRHVCFGSRLPCERLVKESRLGSGKGLEAHLLPIGIVFFCIIVVVLLVDCQLRRLRRRRSQQPLRLAKGVLQESCKIRL